MNLFHLFIKIQHSTANPTLSISTISPSTIELSDEDENLELYILILIRAAKIVREGLVQYLNTEGVVSWQNEIIRE